MKALRPQPDPARIIARGPLPPAKTPMVADESEAPRPLAPAPWDWADVRRVLVVRLRSIGDTALATPSLRALRRFLPDARIDILLEDWVAPLLEGSADIDRLITVRRKSARSRFEAARELRAAGYDVAFNFHGGSTAALLMRASGARRRVGFKDYAYSALHNYLAPPSSELWGMEKTHSAEQQLALPGWVGVPVTDRPAASLPLSARASETVARKLHAVGLEDDEPFALMHPAAAFDSKTWAAANFAQVADCLAARGLRVVAVAAKGEAGVLAELRRHALAPLITFDELSLPEVTALAARAALFVGNDSGIAHIAAAMRAPTVVVFGSSNVAHWRPWTNGPAEVVREEMPCAPCPGYTCAEFGEAQCIRRVRVERVMEAVERVLMESASLC